MINRLKLSGIRFKAMAFTFVLVIVVVALAETIVYRQLSQELILDERHKVAHVSEITSIQFAAMLEGMRQDVLVLASMPPVPGIMRTSVNDGIDPLDGSSMSLWRSRLAEIFVQTLHNKPSYTQIRLIGMADNGHEIVRVERDGESIVHTAAPQLQSKAGRPYFKEGIALSRGQTRISELNLNRENGQLQVPYLPVVRVTTPVYDTAGELFGIVVLNVNMTTILASLNQWSIGKTVLYVANERGDFLVHPDEKKTFAFEFGNSYTLANEFPQFDALFPGNNAGGADGIVDDYSNHRLVLGIHSTVINADDRGKFIRFIHAVPYEVVVAAAYLGNATLVKTSWIAVLLTVPIALFFANRVINPLSRITRSVAAYAAGGEPKDLPVQRKDEIGMLSRSFAQLIGDLQRRMLSQQQEVAERRRAEEESQTSAARFKASIELMRDAHVISDGDGLIQSVNSAGEKIFGYSRLEMIGKNVSMLLPMAEQHGHQACIDRYLKTGKAKIIGKGRDTGVFGLHKDGSTFPLSLLIEKSESAGEIFFTAIIRDLSHEQEIEANNRRLTAVVEQATDSILVIAAGGVIEYVNPQFEREFGYRAEEVIGQYGNKMGWSRSDKSVYADLKKTMKCGDVWSGQLCSEARDGTKLDHDVIVSPIRDETGNVTHFVQIRRNVTARLQLERQLAQAQKLESIGQLAAGIAHEINTPTQYVGDNTRFVKDAFDDIGDLFSTLVELQASANESVSAEALAAAMAKADIEYLRKEVPRALEQTLEGVERVSKIVRAMKEFSHPALDKTPVDLNAAIQSTVTVASNEWKYVADLRMDFDPELPLVTCLPGEFNQVILNIIVNAAHAIIDTLGDAPDEKGTITIATRKLDGWAEIRISDTGAGMPEDVRARIFDPFFTTKEVGKGTGQGLSIAHNVVVEKHGGTIEVDSTPGEGTCFTIRLPLEDATPIDAAT